MLNTKKFPDTILILLGILVLFIILTWVVPAGEFERTEMQGRSVIIPDSYERVEANPQGLGAFLMAPIRGFIGAAQIIAFVFLVGGAFGMLTKSGAIDAGLKNLIKHSQKHPGQKKWLIPLIMVLFSLGGATFGMSEETLVFVLITIPLALALGYDTIVGVAIAFVGAGAGFAGAFINPFTIGIAQGIAELPPFSGMGYRLIVWVIMTTVAVIFVMRYAAKVEKDPQASLVHGLNTKESLAHLTLDDTVEMTRRHRFILFLLLLSLVVLVLGVTQWHWYINEITALFIALGIGTAILAGMNADKAIESFKYGAREMLTPALLIALAKGLIIVAEDGRIIDTILNGIAGMTEGLPKAVSVETMFILQSCLNFFVPSGSGQAALTMPIMAPLSDLLEVGRQTAVLAFQFGDGLSNLIIPTSAITMGVLAIGKIPYNIWLRWMLPLFLIMSVVAMILLAVPVIWDIW